MLVSLGVVVVVVPVSCGYLAVYNPQVQGITVAPLNVEV
jgi:hypothetical protein